MKCFFEPKKLDLREYRLILSDSHFTLCPIGYSSCDIFRFLEAIKFGSIPIFANKNKFYFHKFFGADLPFPVFSDWETASAWVKNMLSMPVFLEDLRGEMMKWWKTYKENLPVEFRKTFNQLNCPQNHQKI